MNILRNNLIICALFPLFIFPLFFGAQIHSVVAASAFDYIKGGILYLNQSSGDKQLIDKAINGQNLTLEEEKRLFTLYRNQSPEDKQTLYNLARDQFSPQEQRFLDMVNRQSPEDKEFLENMAGKYLVGKENSSLSDLTQEEKDRLYAIYSKESPEDRQAIYNIMPSSEKQALNQYLNPNKTEANPGGKESAFGRSSGSGSTRGLVPCSGLDCSWCGILAMGKNIIDFLVKISIPIAVGVIAYGGVLYMTARNSASQMTKAKDALTTAVLAILIVLLAWLVLDTIFKWIAAGDFAANFGPWKEINCGK
ncbi:hypothetical protein HY227_00485 [Candidatus Wolfebacteria bacterium]|nr:hypothetical protein [Candidatus Wolfebacteria bacterium]